VVERLLTQDRVLNRVTLDTADLQALGFPAEFRVEVTVLSCAGFELRLDNDLVTARGDRVLPLKVQLFDQGGSLVTDADILAPPVIQVLLDTGEGGDPVAVSGEALPAGQGTEGKQFYFDDDDRWHLDFGKNAYTAPGTYLLFVDTGDSSEYVIGPTCYAAFTRE
jgi:hypothetical protein